MYQQSYVHVCTCTVHVVHVPHVSQFTSGVLLNFKYICCFIVLYSNVHTCSRLATLVSHVVMICIWPETV